MTGLEIIAVICVAASVAVIWFGWRVEEGRRDAERTMTTQKDMDA